MVQVRKRGAVYGVIGLMLCVAVYLNWSYVKTPDDLVVAGQVDEELGQAAGAETEPSAGSAASASDYFAQSRLSREQARDEAISILKETVESSTADDGAKEAASAKISALAENSVTEARVESLIKAKGYAEAVVLIGDDNLSLIVQPPTGGFAAADAATIKDIIVTETAFSADQIKIVEAG